LQEKLSPNNLHKTGENFKLEQINSTVHRGIESNSYYPNYEKMIRQKYGLLDLLLLLSWIIFAIISNNPSSSPTSSYSYSPTINTSSKSEYVTIPSTSNGEASKEDDKALKLWVVTLKCKLNGRHRENEKETEKYENDMATIKLHSNQSNNHPIWFFEINGGQVPYTKADNLNFENSNRILNDNLFSVSFNPIKYEVVFDYDRSSKIVTYSKKVMC